MMFEHELAFQTDQDLERAYRQISVFADANGLGFDSAVDELIEHGKILRSQGNAVQAYVQREYLS